MKARARGGPRDARAAREVELWRGSGARGGAGPRAIYWRVGLGGGADPRVKDAARPAEGARSARGAVRRNLSSFVPPYMYPLECHMRLCAGRVKGA